MTAFPKPVRWVLSRQMSVTILFAIVAGFFWGEAAGISALCGGGVGFAASLAYAWRALRQMKGDPARIYRSHWLGEGYKMAVTLVLFALVFMYYKQVAVIPLFAAYLATFVVYWVALLQPHGMER